MEAVIFDMDGVIALTEQFHLKAWKRIYQELGLDFSREEFENYFGMATNDILKLLRDQGRISMDDEELLRTGTRKKSYSMQEMRGKIKPMDGLVEKIKEIKESGLKVGLATSATSEICQTTLEECNVKEIFDSTTTSDQVKRSKPDPAIYLKAAETLGIKPSRCMVIEDSQNGIIAAKEAGMKAIAIPTAYTEHLDFSRADLVLGSIAELDIDTIKDQGDKHGQR